ncbi:hypothetical protein N8I77_012826 [Diaporthe amygdali]|uniref:Putative phospholipase n=1 Tax=Phomopsis amygdali TaxID=1214568 RepID=A0AAD9VZ41_PHOAM|nr:hypothetical protein N8I77_012826 [Diaporthe amygdali]
MEENERQEPQQKQPVVPPPPPKTWRERIFHALPYYTGPYSVGYMEVELPVDEPRTFSRIKREHRPALQLDTVLFSVYYPTNADPAAEHRVPWLPRPRVPTCKGYAKFFNIPHLPITAYMATTCMFTKLPAFRNAKLANSWPSGVRATARQRLFEDLRPKFPVVVLSHGLGGSRTMYSSVCGDLASYGFVVVAMEHRDGSGARSYVNVPVERDSPEFSQDNRESASESEPKKAMDSRNEGQPKGSRSYMVDYIFPKDNAQDTAPHNPIGVDHELRDAQIQMRLAEIEEAYKVLQIIDAGDPEDRIRDNNLRKKPNRGSSSRGLDGVDWADWKGRLSLENVTAMGHSFGGATTVQILRLNDHFPWIGQGILLDAWGPAAPEVKPGRAEQTITKPLLSIGSEAFMHWRENYNKIEDICKEAAQNDALCWMTTVRGSTHMSQTDFAVLFPKWMDLFIKTLIHPLRGIYLTIAPTLEFLKIVLPPTQTSSYDTSNWVDDGLLLKSHPDSQISVEHRPDEKWTAARLKIDNEFQVRLQSLWAQTWRKRKNAEAANVPRDARGRPLFGLKTWGPGEEMWVHMCPRLEDLERRLEHRDMREGERSDGEEHEQRPRRVLRCPTM